jgi:hypothetical protein
MNHISIKPERLAPWEPADGFRPIRGPVAPDIALAMLVGRLRLIDQPVIDCIKSQFKAVENAKLVKNVVQVIFDCLLTDKELLANLAIAEALRN